MKKDINFEVLSLKDANKPGYTVAEIKFKGNEKIYTFVRKEYNNSIVVTGCRITYDMFYNLIDITREYETKGIKKKSTSFNTTSKKIKDELSNKGIEISKPEVKEREEIEKVGPVKHNQYENIKMCLEAGIPVYLAGPAGSGKNFTVEQIAEELGWDFYFSNSVQQEYKLTGFIDAGGKFHETEFYKACTSENDSIFFLDEIDASIPEVLVLLNAAIANGYFEFPNGRINFDHVHFVAAGNTLGSGADELYTGRLVLDQATLDRFAIIEFDYDINIEKSITNNNLDLIDFIHNLREQSEQKGIRLTLSYRCMTMVTKLESQGMNLETAIKLSIIKGMDKDTLNTFYLIRNDNNKYVKAFRSLQEAA